MAKDKHRIGEIAGISPAAVVGLNRIGIVTIHDLLHAEFDRVAYIVDDYNEAARLVREAKKVSGNDGLPRRSKGGTPESLVPSPLAPNSMASPNRNQTRIATPNAAPSPTRNIPAVPSGPVVGHIGPESRSGQNLVAVALAIASEGVTLNGEQPEEGRAVLARRLGLASLILEHGGGESEFLAAMLLEAAESGAVQPDDVGGRFGKEVEKLLDECTALRAVPMLPTGKPPRYYLDMARNASMEARRVCAAHLICACRSGPEALPGGAWYAKLLVEALETGAPDELVSLSRQAADGLSRAAA
jgi:hypothetical protein